MSYTPTKLNQHNITKRADGSLRCSSTFKVREGAPRTEQSHKGECDIKNIVRRYAKAGVPLTLPDANRYTGEDYIPPPDYTTAMQLVASAQSRFASLPSKIRDRFKNDPKEYLEFLSNPANAQEAIRLGMATPGRIVAPPPDAPDTASKKPKALKTPAATDDGGQPKGGSPDQ